MSFPKEKVAILAHLSLHSEKVFMSARNSGVHSVLTVGKSHKGKTLGYS